MFTKLAKSPVNMAKWFSYSVLAAFTLGLATSVGIAAMGQSETNPAREYRVADPSNSFPGAKNVQALESAVSYRRASVLWLGTQFQGLNLTQAQEVTYDVPTDSSGGQRTRQARSLYLVYGECRPVDAGSGDGPSCVPPVQVIIRTPGAIPAPSNILQRDGFSKPYTTRGVPAMDLQTATTLWLSNGTTVTIHADPDVREAAVRELRSANHLALNVAEVKPQESVVAFGQAAVFAD